MGLLSKALDQEGADKDDGSPLERIVRYHRANSLFYGIIFERLTGKKKKTKDKRLYEDISALLGPLSTVVDLPSHRVLSLFPHSLDMAVIIHRISMSLGAGVVDEFEADNPDDAFEKIQEYL
jgi:hypothetical protein